VSSKCIRVSPLTLLWYCLTPLTPTSIPIHTHTHRQAHTLASNSNLVFYLFLRASNHTYGNVSYTCPMAMPMLNVECCCWLLDAGCWMSMRDTASKFQHALWTTFSSGLAIVAVASLKIYQLIGKL